VNQFADDSAFSLAPHFTTKNVAPANSEENPAATLEMVRQNHDSLLPRPRILNMAARQKQLQKLKTFDSTSQAEFAAKVESGQETLFQKVEEIPHHRTSQRI
jgi:hypothetical protein